MPANSGIRPSRCGFVRRGRAMPLLMPDKSCIKQDDLSVRLRQAFMPDFSRIRAAPPPPGPSGVLVNARPSDLVGIQSQALRQIDGQRLSSGALFSATYAATLGTAQPDVTFKVVLPLLARSPRRLRECRTGGCLGGLARATVLEDLRSRLRRRRASLLLVNHCGPLPIGSTNDLSRRR